MSDPAYTLASKHPATAYRLVNRVRHATTLATLNDETGELSLHTDWGNWSYRWNVSPSALGTAKGFTDFVANAGVEYLQAKLLGKDDARDFDFDATVEALRESLKREGLAPELRSAALSELEDIEDDSCDDADSFMAFLNHKTAVMEAVYDIYELLRFTESPAAKMLREEILPSLQAALQQGT